MCDFHREQAWLRWLSSYNNGMRDKKELALAMLRKIATSETEKEYSMNVEELKRSNLWNDEKSKAFREWIDKTWLPIFAVCLFRFIYVNKYSNIYSTKFHF